MSLEIPRPDGQSNLIGVLPPSIAERIAAGEVIERPASVVKELVENSLDAGATEISIALKAGGKELIEITDNGRGMSPIDLGLCVKRHATSKLRTLADLERIATLGFRGEALPSIAAVSEMTILSRAIESETAYQLTPPRQRPEPETFGHFLGSPHGTRITAAGLFSEVPARLKFMKSPSVEVSHVREWIERLAISRPSVGFRIITEGRTLLDLRPTRELSSRVKTVLSDGDEYPVRIHTEEHEFGKISIHWLQGLSLPSTRKNVQVINGRAVRDRLLQQAVLTAFRQSLLPGQFPACVLFLDVDPKIIDVNVHPAKSEVRFLESGKIFHAVETLTSRLIATHGAIAHAGIPSGTWRGAEPPATPQWSVSGTDLNRGTAESPQTRHFSQSTPTFDGIVEKSLFETIPKPSYSAEPQAPSVLKTASRASEEMKLILSPEKYIGSVFATYLLYDLGEELGVIDQHAAHERINYEKLKRRVSHSDLVSPPQVLLLPEAVHFEPEKRQAVEQRLRQLTAIGFEAEIFGENALLFRSIPGEWGTDSLRVRLKNLIERLLVREPDMNPRAGNDAAFDEKLFETLASEACHSSIKAGERIGREAALALVRDLLECEHPWNCPHGRPTIARVPRARFEELFKRR